MRAAKLDALLVLSLLLGLSGCYGCCAGPDPYGYGGGCAAYPGYGYDACVGGAATGYDYGYGGGSPPQYDGGYPPPRYGDRLTLRDRIHARREARALRRQGRRPGGRRGRHGDIGCDTCFDGGCCDCGWSDPCCGDWVDCGSCCGCGPCFDSCGSCCDSGMPMSSGCSDCGPCTDGSTFPEGMGGFETYDSGIIESPEMSCAGGNCPLGPEWQGTSVPYSHEGMLEAPQGYSTEPVPHPMNGNQRESLIVPPAEMEGDWESSGGNGDSEVIRAPQAAAPVHQTRWIPPQF